MPRTAASRKPDPSSSRSPARPVVKAFASAVLYARVSSRDQEKEGFSIPAQQKLLRGYAEEHGLRIAEEFTDVETAKRAGRQNFGKMLAWLKQNTSCKVLLVEKTDRLYRNLKDWVALDAMDIEIHLVKEGVVLSDDSRSSEKFIHGIKVLMAKNYVDNLSEEVRKGLQEKAEQGIWPGPAPFGYANVTRADGKRIIDVDPATGPFAKRMFELYATGRYTLKDLVKEAGKQGMVSWKSGNPLHISAIHLILRNPLYKGEYRWLDTWHRGSHPPLVTPELWARVQDIREGRGTTHTAVKKHEFAFNGLVHCGVCAAEGHKRLLVGEIQKEKYVYYHCNGCQRFGRKPKFVTEKTLGLMFAGELRRLQLGGIVLEWIKTGLKSSREEEQRFHKEALAQRQKQITTLQRRLEVAYDDRLDGRITIEEYQTRSNGWREEMARHREEIEQHDRADHAYADQGVLLLELAEAAFDIYESAEAPDKRRLLDFLCLNSEFRGDSLAVDFRKPFDGLAESIDAAKKNGATFPEEGGAVQGWRSGRDLNPRPPA